MRRFCLVYIGNVLLGMPLLAAKAGAALFASDRCRYRLARLSPASQSRRRNAAGGLLWDIAIALENVIRFLLPGAIAAGLITSAVARPMRFGDIRLNHEQLTILVAVIAALAVVWIIFRFTRLGRMMRAVADNPDLAAVRGISRSRVVAYVG